MLRKLADKLLTARLAEVESELEAARRIIAVKDAEIQTLAAVAARNLERVKAEAAVFARQRAECEGTHGRAS